MHGRSVKDNAHPRSVDFEAISHASKALMNGIFGSSQKLVDNLPIRSDLHVVRLWDF